jgi:hypothetical protein
MSFLATKLNNSLRLAPTYHIHYAVYQSAYFNSVSVPYSNMCTGGRRLNDSSLA